ncbi:MAG: DUF1800 domain-containing protein [Planctomycetales bacterium]|nr:DUF1800 domain-containing protein [Planctomycetales bacterium]
MTIQAWERYAPTEAMPWNERRVIHLYRRAAFGATWAQVQRDLRDGPDAAIDRLIAGRTHVASQKTDFESLSQRLGRDAVTSRRVDRLKSWWIFRMIFTPDPLTERLVLMWHNHFATGIQKVRNLSMMKRQNDWMRQFAKSHFRELLGGVVKSPAMLVWLDAQVNHKDHPNENLAREVMELFTLGEGNYTESDVKEAARALTGWTIDEGKLDYDEQIHDDGEKTILGESGRFNGDDLLKILAENKATAKRIANRICELLMGENVIATPQVDALAEGLRTHNLDIRWGIETVLRSERFFRDDNIGNRPLGPIEFIVGAVRGLELFESTPSTLLLSEWSAAMGQDLFLPPSVFGWPGGRAWLTTRTLISRANFAAAAAAGRLHAVPRPLRLDHLIGRYDWSEPEMRSNLSRLLAGVDSGVADGNVYGRNDQVGDSGVAWVETLLASPDAQLG